MGLHDGHRQRCKQRFLRTGAEGFDDHQLLELLLFYAIPRCDTNETAHRLLKRFGSLQGVLYAARRSCPPWRASVRAPPYCCVSPATCPSGHGRPRCRRSC